MKDRISDKEIREILDIEGLKGSAFPLGLILSDELRRVREDVASRIPENELYTVKKENFIERTPFVAIHQHGVGVLRNFIMLSKSSNFTLLLTTDGEKRLEEKFSHLEIMSAELTNAGAYERDDGYMAYLVEYPFRREVKVEVHPHEEMEFTFIRGEAVLVRRPFLDTE